MEETLSAVFKFLLVIIFIPTGFLLSVAIWWVAVMAALEGWRMLRRGGPKTCYECRMHCPKFWVKKPLESDE